jgi:anthranilate/para-aminobenzoate synthase component I
VRRALAYIAAGDCYQVNLAHRLERAVSGEPRAVFADLAGAADPLYGALVQAGPRAVCSLSPELFLSFDAASGAVRTRPMKGTRPLSADPAELRDAAKDRAELDMIVDLMRNDLGRVAEVGTVRVTEPRAIERHGSGVWQATATVEARVRAGIGLGELIGATFPPGSVTGAPKIRAMQIIDELEPASRGPYCGAIGWIGDDGSAELAVAIRTAAMTRAGPGRWGMHYWVGAGIVADSTPEGEWAETLVKAGPVMGG